MRLNRLSLGALTVILAGALLLSAGAIDAAPADAAPSEGRAGGLCLRLGRSQDGLLPIVADILGLAPDEVTAARQAGKSITEIAASQGVEVAELTEEIVAARATALDKLVDEGRISAAEAAARRQLLAERATEQINRAAACPADGNGRRMGQDGGRGWQNRAHNNQ